MLKFKSFLDSICISLLFVGLAVSSAFSATFVVDNDGQLLGAEDVLVNGVYYDVSFMDGTLAELYSGADELTDFTLYYSNNALDQTYLAKLAAEALLDQVFVGIYDAQPTLINGVYTTAAGSTAAAVVVIPYSVNQNGVVSILAVWKWSSEYNDESDIGGSASYAEYDSSPTTGNERYDHTVISVWTPAATSAVPAPSSILLLGSGLFSLAALKRKKFNKA